MPQSDWLIEIEREGITFRVLNSSEPGLNYGHFWSLFIRDWEPMTLRWIKQLSSPDKAFLDIGGWIGPTSIWASKFFQTVHTYEPDPVAFRYLEENASLNSNNIVLCKAAITADGKPIQLLSRGGLGSSMTSMYTGDDSGEGANSVKLSDAIKAADFGLVKVDIEGGERLIIDSLVEEMKANPINLIFSLHHGFFANPDEDFKYIINSLSKVYSKFVLDNGNQVDPQDVPIGFTTILCMA